MEFFDKFISIVSFQYDIFSAIVLYVALGLFIISLILFIVFAIKAKHMKTEISVITAENGILRDANDTIRKTAIEHEKKVQDELKVVTDRYTSLELAHAELEEKYELALIYEEDAKRCNVMMRTAKKLHAFDLLTKDELLNWALELGCVVTPRNTRDAIGKAILVKEDYNAREAAKKKAPAKKTKANKTVNK